MNDKIGNLSYYDPQNEYGFQKPYSDETAKMIDEEVRALVDRAYVHTKKLLTEKRHELEVLAVELLKKEILFQQDLERLIGKRPFEVKHVPELETPVVEEESEVAASTVNENKEEVVVENTGNIQPRIA